MAFRIPDVLRYEIRHRLESLEAGTGGEGPRAWLNAHPVLAIAATGLSVILVVVVLTGALWPTPDSSFPLAKTAWFYDINTGKLFQGSPKKTGPIQAPSGPTADGEPAGFRAHVYSYVREPSDAELFVGFLERPNPDSESKCSASDFGQFDKWARSRLIRRPKDKGWVPATSPEGKKILDEMVRPNKKGQTPIAHTPNGRK